MNFQSACSQWLNDWGYSMKREQEPKALIFYMSLFKLSERNARGGWKQGGACLAVKNTDLPQQRWQAANCNASVGWCLFRRWQIACKKDRICEEDCLRKTFERWNQAFCRYLAAAGEWIRVRPRCFMLFYSPLLGFDLTERSRSLVNANPIFTILNLYSF